MKKMFSLALALIMALALSVPAFAQDVDSAAGGEATITVSNASKGETYSIYKLFDATVADKDGELDGEGPINYTGTIPTDLAAYFEADTAGNITATEAAFAEGSTEVMSDGLKAALKTWAEGTTEVTSAVSDGSVLNFTNLEYGYYVITTSQGDMAISVDSTNPDVAIYDKNSTDVGLTKEVDDDDVFIGQTVTYTVEFPTTNFDGAGEEAEKIYEYVIEDTLPAFLSDVTVTDISIKQGDVTSALTVQQFDANKEITIPWVDEDGNSLYANGSVITITYTAVVTDDAAIDGAGNTNTVTLTWNGDEGQLGELETSVVIYSYAIALKKVNTEGTALAGAEFQFPFYVKETPDADGAYIYAGAEEGDGLTNLLTTPENGTITVKGVASGEYEIVENKAPDGYNKLADPIDIVAVKTGETSTNTTFYLDENGNVTETETKTVVVYENSNIAATAIVVVNKAGVELPSTGGVGTTIFYVVGGLMMAAAGVLLVTKKKVANEEE